LRIAAQVGAIKDADVRLVQPDSIEDVNDLFRNYRRVDDLATCHLARFVCISLLTDCRAWSVSKNE
jgi:hypothetical protein